MKNYIKIDGIKIAIVDIVKELEALRESPKEDTLEDVLDRLPDRGWFVDNRNTVISTDIINRQLEFNKNILNTELRCKQLQAITLLMNVADSLNEGEVDCKWYICLDSETLKPYISSYLTWNTNFAYFKTKELAEKAAKLLGDDMIKLIYT